MFFPRKREPQEDDKHLAYDNLRGREEKAIYNEREIGACVYFLKICSTILSNCNLFE